MVRPLTPDMGPSCGSCYPYSDDDLAATEFQHQYFFIVLDELSIPEWGSRKWGAIPPCTAPASDRNAHTPILRSESEGAK